MNLVIGSTGLLGLEICRQLRARGQPVRALIRPSAEAGKRATLQGLAVQLMEGDLREPSSLRRACAGISTVISTASSTFSRQPGDSIATVDQEGQLALIDAAKGAGVRRFVFVSYRPKLPYPCPLTSAKLAVENRLKSAGIEYVVLRASYFMEVWLTPMLGFDPLHGTVRIYGEGENKLSWVSFRDVARVAALAAHHPQAREIVLDVGGPEALSPHQVVRMFEAAGAAEISPEHVPTATLQAQYEAATDPMQKSFAALMLGYAAGDAMDTGPMTALFPIPLATVRDYVASLLAQRAVAGS
ncbi:SDR family oxidoreductase [Opitutus sp. ER46]|uniref:SDR family oxidoreductase n=1 Tax=Opitutus sp. ER46 TaxID=2161864 RepID=UPI001304B26C|nr:SDR family oxidoreductase [Opitutus sp. ER46]